MEPTFHLDLSSSGSAGFLFLPLLLCGMRTLEECAVFIWTHRASQLVSTFSRLYNSLPAQSWYIVMGSNTHTHTHIQYTLTLVLVGHCPVSLCVVHCKSSSSEMIYHFVVMDLTADLPSKVFPQSKDLSVAHWHVLLIGLYLLFH